MQTNEAIDILKNRIEELSEAAIVAHIRGRRFMCELYLGELRQIKNSLLTLQLALSWYTEE